MALKTVEEIFHQAIAADSVLGPAFGGRIYLVQMPQLVPAYPAMTFQRISTQRIWVHAQSGVGKESSAGFTRFQVDIWSNTATGGNDVSGLAQALINFLQKFNAYSVYPQGGSNFVMNQQLRVEPQTQPPMFRAILDIQIFFSDNT
jgi:hypothetical protein